MKRTTIKKSLETYDKHKGYGRTLIKEEPHIKELRSFYQELKEDKLSPSSLLKLAQILIGKNTRTDTSESGKTFERLVNELGGYKALDTLNAANQLTEDNVAFLEKHPVEAKTLAPLIISISKSMASLSDIKKIFYAAEKIKDSQELITVFKELELISRTENAAYFFINVLHILNNHDFNSDEVLFLLKETVHIIGINVILEILEEKNPSLITLPNLINILKIKQLQHFTFRDLFDCLPPDQESLDSLFHANDTLGLQYYIKEIFINFNKAGWDLRPYLEEMLSGKINDYALVTATTKLIALKLKPELLPTILNAFVTHSNESTELSDAVETLYKEGLDEDFLQLAFKVPKFSKQVAAALVTLQKAQCYNETTKLYICTRPEYALGLAQFWIQFSKAECINPSPRAIILKYPQCASYVADVIDFLRKHELHNEKNIIAICNTKLTSSALLNLLNIMNEAKILDQTSFDLLAPNLSLIKTLYSAAKCLANVEKLDSFNFDSLVSDPINAIALAENIGGKPYPRDYTFIKNPGAQDFAIIRRNTKILCQGHRQGLFFPEMSPEQKQSFEKGRGKTPTEAQKEILVKIAQYSGNQEVEEETEYNIAQETYSSFLRIR